MISLSRSRPFAELLSGYSSISVVGLCKNAGKTTVLNRIIAETAGDGKVTAVTSVGRDGERTDVVTNTDKPGVWLSSGMLFATASKANS